MLSIPHANSGNFVMHSSKMLTFSEAEAVAAKHA
jgi:hypothetical protein